MNPTFRQTFAYILYTNFSCHNSFNFVKMYTKVYQNVGYILDTVCQMWDTSCIQFVYISCIHLVQFLYAKCIHNFRV